MSNDRNQVISLQGTELPVHDEMCERKVIGSIISNVGSFMRVADILTEDCFQTPIARGVFDAIKALDRKGETIDIITVVGELAREGSTIQPFEVAQLSEEGVSYDIDNYALRLKELSVRRRLWALGMRLVHSGVAETEDVEDIQQLASEELNGLFGSINGVYTLTEALRGLSQIMNNNMSKGSTVTGTATGFYRLDEKGGLHGSDLIIIGGESSHGKALPMNAHILTPKGWVKNKDLKVGDEVCSIDGAPSYITGIFPQGVKPMFKITFCDGREVLCSNEHLWEVSISNRKPQIKTAEYIYEKYSKGKHNTLSIPHFSGIFGVRKNFFIHPYILGVLLGDGNLTDVKVRWGKPDKYIVDKVSRLINEDYCVKTYYAKPGLCDEHCIQPKNKHTNDYKTELKRLNLWGKLSQHKFIPLEYLDCCREQRLELLNGLIDTDGHVSKCGVISYSTTSEKLCDDVIYLCHSLGYKACKHKRDNIVNGKKYLPLYYVNITPTFDEEIATLPRKKNRVSVLARRNTSILKIEKIESMECQCISVSHPRELYVTDGFIMTHNTSMMLSILNKVIRTGEKVVVYSMEMTKEQLAARLVAMDSGVPASDIMYKGDFNPQDIEMIDASIGRLPGTNLFFDDESTSNIDSILLSIRKLWMKYKIKGAAIDYLQILSVNSKTANTREQQMADAARRFKNLAKELGIWIIALSQLSRNSQEPEPTLNRLRDSGQIGEAADVVMFVYRPSLKGLNFPHPFENVPQEEVEHKAMISVAKGRNIGVFKFLVNFNAETTHFTDIHEEPIYGGYSAPVEEDAPF